MPRRKKYLTKKRYKSKAKKVYRSRYRRKRLVKGRRGRFKKYHVRKRLAKTYGLRKYAGIKWTRYLNLAEFLWDDKWDMQWVYCTGAQDNPIYTVKDGVSYAFTTAAHQVMKQITQATFSVFSTDLWSNKTWQLQAGPSKKVYLKAYNPVPTSHNLGPLFTIYQNQYKKFKYVGMKVKWIPGVNKSVNYIPNYSTSVYTHNAGSAEDPDIWMVDANLQTGHTYTMLNNIHAFEANTGIDENTFTEAYGSDYGKRIYTDSTGNEEIPLAKTAYYAFQPTMALRLWVNFDKKGYESVDLPINNLAGATLSATGASTTDGRFKLRRMFDDDGFKKTISDSTLKSYSLLKPFKFYVRPKLARKFQEEIENETVVTNAEEKVTLMQELSSMAEEQSSLVQTSLKVPYLSTFRTYPVDTLMESPIDWTTINVAAGQVVRSWTGIGHFDPVLFGWGLSCDNLPLRQQLDLFSAVPINKGVDNSRYQHMKYQIQLPPAYNAYGKFKVTYYCRFKEFNPMQAHQSLNQANALGEVELSNVEPKN